MTLKQKIWNIGNCVIPFKSCFNLEKISRNTLLFNAVCSGFLVSALGTYILFAFAYKTPNPKEICRTIKQETAIARKESDLREKLYSFIDRDGNKIYSLDELKDFCEKTGIDPGKFPLSNSSIYYNLGSWGLEDLEKAVQSYELGERNEH